MMHRRYRVLERQCQIQAAFTGHEETKQELKKMAREYGALAGWLEHRQQPADETKPTRSPRE